MDIKQWANNKLGGGDKSEKQPPGPPPPPSGMDAGSGGMDDSLFNKNLSGMDVPEQMQEWVEAGGESPEHPMGPPAWATDKSAYQHAVSLVKKNWDSYAEPWAIVALAYDAMAMKAPAPQMGAPKPLMPPAASGVAKQAIQPGAPQLGAPKMPPGTM